MSQLCAGPGSGSGLRTGRFPCGATALGAGDADVMSSSVAFQAGSLSPASWDGLREVLSGVSSDDEPAVFTRWPGASALEPFNAQFPLRARGSRSAKTGARPMISRRSAAVETFFSRSPRVTARTVGP